MEPGENATLTSAGTSPFLEQSVPDLIAAICQGNEEALLHLLVDRCGGLIRRFSIEFKYDGDLMQDVAVHLYEDQWRRLKSWNGESSFSSWLRTVLNHLCINKFRDRVKYQNRFARLQEWDDPSQDAEVEKWAELEDLRSNLLRAIERLSPRDQLIIKLHYLGSMTIEELADHLGMSVAATRTIRTRAKDRLGVIVREEESDDV